MLTQLSHPGLPWPVLFSSSPLPSGLGSLFLFGLLGGGSFQFAPKCHACWQLTWASESWGRGSRVSTGVQAQRRSLTPRVKAGPTAPSPQASCSHIHSPAFVLGLGVGSLGRPNCVSPDHCPAPGVRAWWTFIPSCSRKWGQLVGSWSPRPGQC